MTKLTETAIEAFAIQLFQQLGYNYHGSGIAPDGDTPAIHVLATEMAEMIANELTVDQAA